MALLNPAYSFELSTRMLTEFFSTLVQQNFGCGSIGKDDKHRDVFLTDIVVTAVIPFRSDDDAPGDINIINIPGAPNIYLLVHVSFRKYTVDDLGDTSHLDIQKKLGTSPDDPTAGIDLTRRSLPLLVKIDAFPHLVPSWSIPFHVAIEWGSKIVRRVVWKPNYFNIVSPGMPITDPIWPGDPDQLVSGSWDFPFPGENWNFPPPFIQNYWTFTKDDPNNPLKDTSTDYQPFSPGQKVFIGDAISSFSISHVGHLAIPLEVPRSGRWYTVDRVVDGNTLLLIEPVEDFGIGYPIWTQQQDQLMQSTSMDLKLQLLGLAADNTTQKNAETFSPDLKSLIEKFNETPEGRTFSLPIGEMSPLGDKLVHSVKVETENWDHTTHRPRGIRFVINYDGDDGAPSPFPDFVVDDQQSHWALRYYENTFRQLLAPHVIDTPKVEFSQYEITVAGTPPDLVKLALTLGYVKLSFKPLDTYPNLNYGLSICSNAALNDVGLASIFFGVGPLAGVAVGPGVFIGGLGLAVAAFIYGNDYINEDARKKFDEAIKAIPICSPDPNDPDCHICIVPTVTQGLGNPLRILEIGVNTSGRSLDIVGTLADASGLPSKDLPPAVEYNGWENGIVFNGDQQAILKPSPAQLVVRPGKWGYPYPVPCVVYDGNPVMLVELQNAGERPLTICWIWGHDIFEITDYDYKERPTRFGKPAFPRPFPLVIQAGASFTIMVKARVDSPSYKSFRAAPPPVRARYSRGGVAATISSTGPDFFLVVQSTGGAIRVNLTDLAKGQPAPMDPVNRASLQGWADSVCDRSPGQLLAPQPLRSSPGPGLAVGPEDPRITPGGSRQFLGPEAQRRARGFVYRSNSAWHGFGSEQLNVLEHLFMPAAPQRAAAVPSSVAASTKDLGKPQPSTPIAPADRELAELDTSVVPKRTTEE